MSSNSPSRFLIGESGRANVFAIAEAFFGSCVKRLAKHAPYPMHFQPWMSSTEFSKRISDGLEFPSIIEPNGKLDFRQIFLSSVSDLYNSKDHINVFDELENHQIFVAIETIGKESVQLLSIAYDLVERWPAWQQEIFNKIVQSVVPICRKEDQSESGNAVSSRHALGMVFVSSDPSQMFPDISLNIDLAHELGHQIIFMIQHMGALFFEDAMVYSPIRKVMRPAIRSLHAAAAMGYMIESAQGLLKTEQDMLRRNFLLEKIAEFQSSLRLGLIGLEPLKKSPICDAIIDDLRQINAVC